MGALGHGGKQAGQSAKYHVRPVLRLTSEFDAAEMLCQDGKYLLGFHPSRLSIETCMHTTGECLRGAVWRRRRGGIPDVEGLT
jgi:hypothetical protein